MRMIFIFIDSLLKTAGFAFSVVCIYEYINDYIKLGNKFEFLDFMIVIIIIYFFVRVVIDWRR